MLESKVAEMLDQLAEKLGVASAKVWEWALLQVKVNLIQDVCFVALFLLSVIGIYKLAIWVNENDLFDECDFLTILGTILGICWLLIGGLFAIFALFEIPELLINPEWAAFQKIMSQLGSLK